eukprot:gene7306-8085_t
MALNFPAKIYQILENESADIIRWLPNGAAFRIVDHGRFEREIIPKYFRHNQLSSVQRQLNLYGFKCINRGEDKGAFFHPKFRRGDWEVVKRITRYAPLKKGDSPTEKKEGSVVKLAENQVVDTSIPVIEAPAPGVATVAAAAQQVAANVDGRYHPVGMPYSTPYSQPVHHYPHFDAFFHHPDLNTGHNWAWPIIPQSSVYSHNYVPAAKSVDNSERSNSVPVMEVKHMEPPPLDTASSISSSSESTVAQSGQFNGESGESGKPFISVVNQVVTIDPYFDLSDDFGLFHHDELRNENISALPNAIPSSNTIPSPPSDPDNCVEAEAVPPASQVDADSSSGMYTTKRMVDVGVNTVISQHNLPEIFQFCYEI